MPFREIRVPCLVLMTLIASPTWTSGAAQKPRKTELMIDSVAADSVRCGGVTIQLARFFKDNDELKTFGANVMGTRRQAIEIWISNRSDSVVTWDPHMLMALNNEGAQVTFLSAQELSVAVSGKGFLFAAENQQEAAQQGMAREKTSRELAARPEYQAGKLLPGAAGGRRILVPDNDKKLGDGITLFCGDKKLGWLSKVK